MGDRYEGGGMDDPAREDPMQDPMDDPMGTPEEPQEGQGGEQMQGMGEEAQQKPM